MGSLSDYAAFARAEQEHDAGFRQYLRDSWQSLGWPTPILWTFAPDSGNLLGACGEQLSVYHCVDDFQAAEQFNHYRRVAAYDTSKSEEFLARSVDVALASAQPLFERWRTVNANTYLMPNVADTALFRQALEPGRNIRFWPGFRSHGLRSSARLTATR